MAVRTDRQVRALKRRAEIGGGRAATAPVALCHLVIIKSPLVRAVEIIGFSKARFYCGIDEQAGQ